MSGGFRYLLDTNIVSGMARNPQGVVAENIRRVGADSIAISIIVACEIEFGLAKIGSCRLADNVRAILAELPVIPFEQPAHSHYGDIRAGLEKAGTPLGPNDLLIAAHARALDMVLITNNEREFSRVPGLEVENWLRSTD